MGATRVVSALALVGRFSAGPSGSVNVREGAGGPGSAGSAVGAIGALFVLIILERSVVPFPPLR